MAFAPSLARLTGKPKASSQAWISRQFRDPYVKKRFSDPAAYRSRSAFKLLEIDDQWGEFLMKQDVRVVVDLGAAPGGWSQVVAGKLGWGKEPLKLPAGGLDYGEKSKGAIERLGTWSGPVVRRGRGSDLGEKEAEEGFDPLSVVDVKQGKEGRGTKRKRTWSALIKEAEEAFDPLNVDDMVDLKQGEQGRGTILAVDLLRVQPIYGVHAIQGDFLAPETQRRLHDMLSVKGNIDGRVDVVLSDMAANMTGHAVRDAESSLEICRAVYEFARGHLRPWNDIGRKAGGVLLMKHFAHPYLQKFRDDVLKPNFRDVKYIKPGSSRSDSSEGYFLCRGWLGLDTER